MVSEINDRRPKGYRTRLIDLLPLLTNVLKAPFLPFNVRSTTKIAMKKISEINNFVRYDMWRRTASEYNGFFQRLGYAVMRTIALVIRGFTSKNLNDTAKSLTYSLIFAVIPILAMVVAVAKGFGVLDIIEQQLNHSYRLGRSPFGSLLVLSIGRACFQPHLERQTLSFYSSSGYDVYRDSGLDSYAPCLQRRYHDLHSFDRGECDSAGKGI